MHRPLTAPVPPFRAARVNGRAATLAGGFEFRSLACGKPRAAREECAPGVVSAVG
jgi:hypothetical protein